MNVSGFLYSQIGYDTGLPMTAVIRSGNREHVPDGATFELYASDEEGTVAGGARPTGSGAVRYWGETWNAHWWEIDFSGIRKAGWYIISITAPGPGGELHRSEPIRVGENVLWRVQQPRNDDHRARSDALPRL